MDWKNPTSAAPPMRRIVEAILYLLRGGLPWRMLPPCFPPVSTVRRWFYMWRDDRLWLAINHTLLTLDAARSAGLRVVGVAMTPWPLEPSAMELSNRDMVERLGGIEVSRLPAARPGALADAAETLPLERWLDG